MHGWSIPTIFLLYSISLNLSSSLDDFSTFHVQNQRWRKVQR
jgi:hypothetical protein